MTTVRALQFATAMVFAGLCFFLAVSEVRCVLVRGYALPICGIGAIVKSVLR